MRPRSRLVDFNKFYYNLKVTRGGHELRHESTGTRARGTKARVLDMLDGASLFSLRTSNIGEEPYEVVSSSVWEEIPEVDGPVILNKD